MPDPASVAPEEMVRRAQHALLHERLRLAGSRLHGFSLWLALSAAAKTFAQRVRKGRQLPAWHAALHPTVTVKLVLASAGAALAICAIGFALFFEWRSATYTVASVGEQQRATLAPPVPVEIRPERDLDITYSRANVRYCIFQQVRLEAVGPIVDVADQGVFSAHVADWNARCANYRYDPADKAAIDTEAAGRRALLAAEGRALMSGWRRKITSTMQDRPLSAPSLDSGTGAPGLADVTTADPLPPLIRLGRAATDDADRDAAMPVTLPSLALMRVEVALRVQKRLNDLGYVVAPADGTWGAMSRSALRRFKKANGLLANDAFDAETAARLFSAVAVSAPTGMNASDDTTASIETAYPPPPAGNMNPLNRADGQRVQRRLAELGYYTGRGDGLWGAASRTALRNFKLMNGLKDNGEWDAMTEAMLFSDAAARASEAVRGQAVPPPAAVSAAAKRPAAAKSGEPSATGDAPRPPAGLPGWLFGR
jgi:peptidoglycan hydrolase-like protein with peptidoglycan-binding domain